MLAFQIGPLIIIAHHGEDRATQSNIQPRFGSVIDNRVSIGFHMITGRFMKTGRSGLGKMVVIHEISVARLSRLCCFKLLLRCPCPG